jgi:hypothetical protein
MPSHGQEQLLEESIRPLLLQGRPALEYTIIRKPEATQSKAAPPPALASPAAAARPSMD